EALERLAGGELPPPGSPFGDALRAFLDDYGHRAGSSWEVFSPRWADAPAQLVPLLRAQRAGEPVEPSVRAARQQEEFLAAERELRELLSGARLAALEGLVHLTRRYLLLRENQRFWFDRVLHALHRTLLWLGGRFVQEGWLERPADVAFLTLGEVRSLAEGALAPDAVPEWVARRKARRELDRAHEPPVFLRGGDAADEPSPGARLQGLGISPGRARGVVRVVRSLEEGHRLVPGEVLVARAVDPGWTPLFVHAAAVVLEMG